MDVDRAIFDGAAAAIVALYNQGFLNTEETVAYYMRQAGVSDQRVIDYWIRYYK
jgi:hypothetical protein